MVKDFKTHRFVLDFDNLLLRIFSKEKNEIKSTYLSFITHQAVNIQKCTCTPNIHKNDKNSTSPYI